MRQLAECLNGFPGKELLGVRLIRGLPIHGGQIRAPRSFFRSWVRAGAESRLAPDAVGSD
jgi:hypothetical protein